MKTVMLHLETEAPYIYNAVSRFIRQSFMMLLY